MFNKTQIKFYFILLTSLQVSCGDTATNINISPKFDLSFTEIISKKPVLADGKTKLIARLRVFDENRDPIEKVKINISNHPESVTSYGCTVSNSEGIIDCSFSSNMGGEMNITLSSRNNNLPITIEFRNPYLSKSHFTASASEKVQQTTSGYLITTEVGTTKKSHKAPNGYDVNIK